MLRSIRYGEADRILHLYTPDYGRVGAIAKGARRARSRFGARLEPFFQHPDGAARGARRALYGHRRRHGRGPRRRCATTPRRSMPPPGPATPWRGCSRPHEPHPEVFHLLANELALLAADPAHAAAGPGPWPFASSCSWRRGSCPQLGSCAGLRRARAPDRLLGRSRRRRLQLVRGGLVPAGRGVPTSSWLAAIGTAAGARRRRPPSSRCGRPSGRSARRRSITPRCGCGRCCARRALCDYAAGPAGAVRIGAWRRSF